MLKLQIIKLIHGRKEFNVTVSSQGAQRFKKAVHIFFHTKWHKFSFLATQKIKGCRETPVVLNAELPGGNKVMPESAHGGKKNPQS